MQAEQPADPPPPFDVAKAAALMRDSPAGMAVFDTELRYLYVNPALERLNGIPAAAHLGKAVAEVLPGVDAAEEVMRAVLADGKPREAMSSGRTWASVPEGERFWQGAYHRLEEDGEVRGLVGVVLEISVAHHQQRELEQARSYLSLLDTASATIGTTLDMDTTCRELVDFVVPALADVAVVEVFPPEVGHAVRRPPEGVVRLRRAAMALGPGLRDTVSPFGAAGEYIDYQQDAAVQRCLATNRPVIENLYSDEQLDRSAPTRGRVAGYRAVGLHSAVIVPLTARGRPLGVLALARTGDSPVFTEGGDVVIARELAGRAAVDLDHARRYAHEHTIARELQRSLLSEPRGPHPHVQVASRYRPADEGALVGGDWFDVIPLRDGRHLKAMGDVMGHGVEAAVAMSHYRSILRAVAEDDMEPHRILQRLDDAVVRSGVDRAATCLLAVVDRYGGICRLASAGHLPPVFLDPGAPRARVAAHMPVGPPLGSGFGGYETTDVPCGPGTVLFMYTDGLVERRGEDIDVSVGRLASLTLPASGRLEDLLDEVLDRFAENAEDDIAVLASRVHEGASFSHHG
ncbi:MULTISPECIES: SpoIIE family protein phosphatase [unclassified Streptomyces]|uniref:SpoIIE family protein phosphatase n=1 Tax=Streptomyces TaxID=1883 RepID=UPI0001C1B119|nr:MULTISPECIES: SpoIIE family protein phosphatase [unclassified Streptomyces]AEN11049.1 putative PAS/PAC sensor protein [Streptomyces sp. SirexAA-E]MYR65921.1 SpoIIE family protein phosphatase [Streptomyces sp. SID4939]MYS04376.1 SpoIIE family protein phosphatase [Streptomyces sp. SID4940]MYT63684.1 SpoIIE family protein phosphatase [Streptomyces sp. SID8357]MYT85934.1 SpoIIE family protein phosphatase [Streptomyces sp. SID8360]